MLQADGFRPFQFFPVFAFLSCSFLFWRYLKKFPPKILKLLYVILLPFYICTWIYFGWKFFNTFRCFTSVNKGRLPKFPYWNKRLISKSVFFLLSVYSLNPLIFTKICYYRDQNLLSALSCLKTIPTVRDGYIHRSPPPPE